MNSTYQLFYFFYIRSLRLQIKTMDSFHIGLTVYAYPKSKATRVELKRCRQFSRKYLNNAYTELSTDKTKSIFQPYNRIKIKQFTNSSDFSFHSNRPETVSLSRLMYLYCYQTTATTLYGRITPMHLFTLRISRRRKGNRKKETDECSDVNFSTLFTRSFSSTSRASMPTNNAQETYDIV